MNKELFSGGHAGPIVLLGCLLAACQSTPEKPGQDARATSAAAGEAEPYDPSWEIQDAQDTIGKILADLDSSMRAWSRLMLEAETDTERRAAKNLQRDMMRRVHKHEPELIAELEGGPPLNRARAASVLGFAGSDSALSPLIAALDDVQDNVVHNALLGLAILQNPSTPLDPLARIMREHEDPTTRQNAGYAIRTVMEAGGSATPSALEAARMGIADSEPLVRVQASLILGLAADADSIDGIETLLYDELPLVRRASGKALVLIGLARSDAKGAAARALSKAYQAAPKSERPALLKALVELAQENLGEDPKEWREWAYRMP